MPRKPEWIQRIPEALERLKHLPAPVIDRGTLQVLLGLHRRAGIRLMHRWGGYQAGRTFLIERETLARQLEAIAAGQEYQQESKRRSRLLEELEKARREWEGRKVRIPVNPNAPTPTLLNLPPDIQLQPGELRIAFREPEDLLALLLELSQAIMNDYERFTQVIQSNTVKRLDV